MIVIISCLKCDGPVTCYPDRSRVPVSYTGTGERVRPGGRGQPVMSLDEIYMIFGRREKCFMTASGHNAEAKYVISRNGTYVTACGDHLTRGINQALSLTNADGRIDVRVWVRP